MVNIPLYSGGNIEVLARELAPLILKYASVGGTDEWFYWLPSKEFVAYTDSSTSAATETTLSGFSAVHAWEMDSSGGLDEEVVVCSWAPGISIPTGVTATLYFAGGGGGGNVYAGWGIREHVDGELISTSTSGNIATFAMPDSRRLKIHTPAKSTTYAGSAADSHFVVRVTRWYGHGNDTAPNSAFFLGALLKID